MSWPTRCGVVRLRRGVQFTRPSISTTLRVVLFPGTLVCEANGAFGAKTTSRRFFDVDLNLVDDEDLVGCESGDDGPEDGDRSGDDGDVYF